MSLTYMFIWINPIILITAKLNKHLIPVFLINQRIDRAPTVMRNYKQISIMYTSSWKSRKSLFFGCFMDEGRYLQWLNACYPLIQNIIHPEHSVTIFILLPKSFIDEFVPSFLFTEGDSKYTKNIPTIRKYTPIEFLIIDYEHWLKMSFDKNVVNMRSTNIFFVYNWMEVNFSL